MSTIEGRSCVIRYDYSLREVNATVTLAMIKIIGSRDRTASNLRYNRVIINTSTSRLFEENASVFSTFRKIFPLEVICSNGKNQPRYYANGNVPVNSYQKSGRLCLRGKVFDSHLKEITANFINKVKYNDSYS